MDKFNKPSTLKHVLIAAGSAAVITTGVSVGVTYAVVSKQDKLPRYTVTFKNWDGTILQQSTVKIGDNAKYTGEKPKRPTEDWIDYTFSKWDKPLTNILCDTEFTAEYTSKHQTYECIFYSDESCTTELYRATANKGEMPEYVGDVPTKDPTDTQIFVFAGWTYDEETWQHGSQKVYPRFNAAPKGMAIEDGKVTSYTGSSEVVEIPSEWGGKPVTTIASNAFTPNSNASVTKVTLPTSITTIEDKAFQYASNLTTVVFTDGINLQTIGESAFGECTSLQEITLPASLHALGKYTFVNCTGLTTINLNNVVDLGEDAFDGCSNLTKVTVSSSNPRLHTIEGIDGILFGTSELGTILVKCMPGVSDLSKLKNIEDLWLITNNSFENCKKIGDVDLTGTSVIQIDDKAFANSSITSFKCGDKIERLTGKVFENCLSLTSITFGKGIVEYGITADTLNGCVNLAEIKVDEGNAFYYSQNGILYWKEDNCLVRCPPALATPPTLPAGCTEIYTNAFNRCQVLTEYTVPPQITKIGDYAFSECPKLTKITFNTSEELDLGEEIFKDCPLLETMEFGAAAKISQSAKAASLSGCTALKEINVADGNPQLKSVNGVLYTKFNDAYWLTRYPSAKEGTTFDIPSDVDSVAVTTVARLAFDSAKNLETISLSSNLKSIYNYAFNNCSSLKTLSCKKGFTFDSTQVKTTVFEGCTSLKTVEVQEINSNITSFLSFISDNLPESGTTLTLRLSPQAQTSIDAYQCASSKYLKAIEIDEGITTIGESAFQGCTQLETVALPNSLTSLGKNAFLNCYKITQISGQMTGLTTINTAAFGACLKLQTLDFSNCSQLKTIGSWAFSLCESLTTISIPGNVTSIGTNAFNTCINLRQVNFAGSKETFNRICGGYKSPFIECSNVTINCSDGPLYID